jgi:hypothetical protein
MSKFIFFALASIALAAPHAGDFIDCSLGRRADRHGHHRNRLCMHQLDVSGIVNEAPVSTETILSTTIKHTTVTSTITITSSGVSESDVSETPYSTPSQGSSSAQAPEQSPAVNANKAAVEQPASSSEPISSVAAVVANLVSSTSAPAPAPSASSGCLRGIPYADAQNTTPFSGKKITWAYNWGSSAGNLASSFEYVPMLWGTDSMYTSSWQSNAEKAIAAGSTHLLGFNEPDLTAQANLSPDAAATAYKSYLSDAFGGKNIRLGAPAVTNGPAPMGLAWLSNFMTACSSCQVDFVPIHWYDSATNVEYFKKHVQEAHQQTGKPLWITELGASGSDEEVKSFLQTILPWLDTQPYVERVAYFMAKDGLLMRDGGLSVYGDTYATV